MKRWSAFLSPTSLLYMAWAVALATTIWSLAFLAIRLGAVSTMARTSSS